MRLNNIISYNIFLSIIFLNYCQFVQGRGFLLLYKPKDVTVDCAFSKKLRYDLSFGNGMSDTITVTLRTLEDIDYECQIDITTDHYNKIIVVIHFPTPIIFNCDRNPRAFELMKMDQLYPICAVEHLVHQEINSRYWVLYTQGRFRFIFRSNSSINSDLGAWVYSVTVTTARERDRNGRCFLINETDCYSESNDQYYCITSGTVCDGIKNCGAEDWYDERKSACEVPIQHLEYTPIFAVLAIILCASVAGIHYINKCLPKSTSFFIYNTDENNMFRIDPHFETPIVHFFEPSDVSLRKKSLIPISSSSSDDNTSEDDVPAPIETEIVNSSLLPKNPKKEELIKIAKLPTKKIKTVSERLQQRFRNLSGYMRRSTGVTVDSLPSISTHRKP